MRQWNAAELLCASAKRQTENFLSRFVREWALIRRMARGGKARIRANGGEKNRETNVRQRCLYGRQHLPHKSGGAGVYRDKGLT